MVWWGSAVGVQRERVVRCGKGRGERGMLCGEGGGDLEVEGN